MRSKSKLIIYNMMLEAGLKVDNDKEILPDFTKRAKTKRSSLGTPGNAGLKGLPERWTAKSVKKTAISF